MPLLLLLNRKREVAIVGLSALCVILFLRLRGLQADLKMAELVYKNPAKTETKAAKIETGPVSIKTTIKKQPTGETETTIEETHAPVVETTQTATEMKPVPLEITLRPWRENRWLLGISNRNFTVNQIDHYGAWGGYSWHNRADLLLGLEKNDRAEARVLLVWRF